MAITLHNTELVYVPAMSGADVGLPFDVPSHVKIVWYDAQERRCSYIFDLDAKDLEVVKKLSEWEEYQKSKKG